jgi:nucleotide-binding universal stress UspA family protein
MTQPILIPLDGSARADGALPYAIALARVEGCALELLAVAEPLGAGPDAGRLASLVAEGLRSHLDQVAERLRETGLPVEALVRDGNPADVILDHADVLHARLIVITTRGHGGVQRWLVGSVADKVVRGASCPVLLLRPVASADPATPWRPRRLLVPLDGSPLAEQALPLAYRWAAAFAAEVLLVRVEPWLATQVAVTDGYLPDVAAWDEQAAQAAEAYLAEIRQRAPAGVTLRANVLRGAPAITLTDYAEREQIDLTVMTSHGRGGLRRLVLGSVADRLIREGPPVCVVHPAEPEAGPAATTAGTAPA